MFVFIAAVVHLSVHFMCVLFYGDVLQICELSYHLRARTVSAMPWCSNVTEKYFVNVIGGIDVYVEV